MLSNKAKEALSMALETGNATDKERAALAREELALIAGGLPPDEWLSQLRAGNLYDVDTMSAGYDMIIDAADEDDALFAVADFAGRLRGTPAGNVVDEALTRGWTAKRVTI